jgi:hypothetical protein
MTISNLITFTLVSLISGVLFGVLDGLINANPLAVRLYEAYKPIAKASVNFIAGIVIDLAYGFILAGLFLLLYPALPGASGLAKGVSYGLLAWFFRVVMGVISQWMMYTVARKTLVYTLLAGLVEMLALGILYGLTLHPGG